MALPRILSMGETTVRFLEGWHPNPETGRLTMPLQLADLIPHSGLFAMRDLALAAIEDAGRLGKWNLRDGRLGTTRGRWEISDRVPPRYASCVGTTPHGVRAVSFDHKGDGRVFVNAGVESTITDDVSHVSHIVALDEAGEERLIGYEISVGRGLLPGLRSFLGLDTSTDYTEVAQEVGRRLVASGHYEDGELGGALMEEEALAGSFKIRSPREGLDPLLTILADDDQKTASENRLEITLLHPPNALVATRGMAEFPLDLWHGVLNFCGLPAPA